MVRAQEAAHDDMLDPYVIDQAFRVDCGTRDAQRMRIVYRGDARTVYAAEAPGSCVAVETAALNWEFSDARQGDCPFRKDEDLEVYFLDVVVQMEAVHRAEDARHVLTCSYELSALGSTGEQEADDSLLARTPQLQAAGNR